MTPESQASSFPNFRKTIESASIRNHSRIILALDLNYRNDVSQLANDAKELVRETSDFLCGVKLNFHLIAPLGLSELRSINELILGFNLPSIADIKLNDIDNTNRVATEYLWKACFSAVIVNPFAGYIGGLDVVLDSAKKQGKGVIALAYMSHRGADEGYGLVLKDGNTIHDLFLENAKNWGVDGIIMGSTRPEKIGFARTRIGNDIKIFSPGSVTQGGDPLASLEAGSDYLIVGRSIVDSDNPRDKVKDLHFSLLPWIERH